MEIQFGVQFFEEIYSIDREGKVALTRLTFTK